MSTHTLLDLIHPGRVPGPKLGGWGSAKGQQAGRGLTKREAGEGRAVHACVSAQLCPGHTRVQSIDGHTCAWGGEGKLGGGGRHQVPSLLGSLTLPALSSGAPPFPTLELTLLSCSETSMPGGFVLQGSCFIAAWRRASQPECV